MVRAKFICTSIEHQMGGNKRMKLQAVSGGSDEDKDFTKYTPSGELSILITEGTPANEFFEVGERYYLDFSKAPK